MDWRTLNPRVIAEFRQNAGKVAGFEGLPLILLQTKGARSGNRFDVPLIPVLEDARIFLFGTNAGSPKQPIWALNVLAHPRIVVEYEARIFEAIIEPLSCVDADVAPCAAGARQRTTPAISCKCSASQGPCF